MQSFPADRNLVQLRAYEHAELLMHSEPTLDNHEGRELKRGKPDLNPIPVDFEPSPTTTRGFVQWMCHCAHCKGLDTSIATYDVANSGTHCLSLDPNVLIHVTSASQSDRLQAERSDTEHVKSLSGTGTRHVLIDMY